MNCIEFSDVSFKYPPVEGDVDENGRQIEPSFVFDHFTGGIPAGFTSLIGPNGSGKSTFLLLASGRLCPQNGKCRLFEQDILHLPEEQKNLLASVIYQNMEFESNDKVYALLQFVYEHGALKGNAQSVRGKEKDLLAEVIEVFELGGVLQHGLKELSKGEIQRVLLAFSLLYGSASVFMDEPMFAMEPTQKENSLAYLKEYAAKTNVAFFISMHELDLTRKYAENVILFYPNRDMDYGTPEEVMTDEALEKAYGVPVSMLKNGEDMTREELVQSADAILAMQNAESSAEQKK
ncbi:MAG: ABC transporter ATP-binding protein [Treponema sp.]|nr:ABC transporter ATP-binding protein [Treponema sp.]